MAIILGVARETAPGEKRVALTPETCRKFVAVLISAVRIIAGVQSMFFCLINVTTPAVIGELNEVPDADRYPVGSTM